MKSMIIDKFSQYIDSINEGLIKTHEGSKAISYVVDTLRRLGFDVEGEFTSNIISLKLKNFNYLNPEKVELLFEHLKMIMTNKFGWFPASMDLIMLNGMRRLKPFSEEEIKYRRSGLQEVEIQFDSKFDDYEYYTGKLYHLSIQEYLPKILKTGISPKSKSKLSLHIDRIYVCKVAKECQLLIPQMKLHYSEEQSINRYDLGNKKWRKNTKWVIFEIKVEQIKIYKDPRYEEGFYIPNNIKPGVIRVFKKED